MKKLLNDVAKFQQAYEAPCFSSVDESKASGRITQERIKLRLSLVIEEWLELMVAHGMLSDESAKEAMNETPFLEEPALENMEGIGDAITDLIYVLVGMALEYGIPLDRVWDEVQRTNMAKFPDGKALFREDGKLIKPEGWEPPDIKALIPLHTEAEWSCTQEEASCSSSD